MRESCLIATLIICISGEDSKRDKRLKLKGVIGTKEMNLPPEMISEVIIASNNTALLYNDMLNAYQYPVNYKSKDHTKHQRGEELDESEFKDLGEAKVKKGAGVESRWRYRLTNCQRSQTCECGEHINVPASHLGTEGSFKSNTGKFYSRNSNCMWTVSAPKDYTILMRFKNFAIEREDVCGFDYSMIFSGRMKYLNQPSHNLTVHSHGVFCGSLKFPQNVGDDDWADKTILIPTADSGDGSLNRTFFNGVWMDLRTRNAGIIFVSDSDTQHTGFELQYKVVPVVQHGVNVSSTFDAVEYVKMKVLEHVRSNPLDTPERIKEKEHQVNKTLNRIHKAAKKRCFFLKDNLVPVKVQDGIKQTNTVNGYFPFMLDLIVVSHKKCRTRHRYAWRKRFNKLVKFLTKKTATLVDPDVNQSDLNALLPLMSSEKPTEEIKTNKETHIDQFTQMSDEDSDYIF